MLVPCASSPLPAKIAHHSRVRVVCRGIREICPHDSSERTMCTDSLKLQFRSAYGATEISLSTGQDVNPQLPRVVGVVLSGSKHARKRGELSTMPSKVRKNMGIEDKL